MSRSRRPVRGLAALAAAALTVSLVPAFAGTASTAAEPAPAVECPPGMVATTKTAGERAFEQGLLDESFSSLLGELNEATAGDPAVCRPVREPEPFAELAAMQAERNVLSAGPLGVTPPGAVMAAVAGKTRAMAAAKDVPAAQGQFTPVGTTPLISDDETYPSTSGSGLADLAGRVDSFTYDEVNKRLFAAPGTGGVYVSTDLGGLWTSVGDALPYQSVGAISWSPVGTPADGTLLLLSGEASAGGNVYTGIGALYSTDSGRTWQQSAGIPDGLMGFEIDVDPTDPTIVYAATSQGLYRSTDTGKTYVNVNLPTGTVEGPDGPVDCAGKTGYNNLCQNANWVTDVEIKSPGGVGDDTEGGEVLAAVGYRGGTIPYPGTQTPQSPQNGLYKSPTGEVGSFAFLDVYGTGGTDGFAPQEQIGRTELGSATGPEQDHGFLYAIVQDAVLFNGGVPAIDANEPTGVIGPFPNNTSLNGVYVSPDFGESWTRMAEEVELQSPVTESALLGVGQAAFVAPGVQAWYNMWIEPDPTTATASGVPTRLVFGLEEVWESRLPGTPQDGATQSLEPASFRVIGPYFSDTRCMLLLEDVPYCPPSNTGAGQTTTHPDQQSGIWIPGEDGGVSLVVGNDGGTYVQTLEEGGTLSKTAWGRGNQNGFHTLLPYDANVAKDGTIVFGLQDNGSGHIEPDGKQVMTFGGDGFFAAVDPDNSDVYYNEVTLGSMRVTTDRGRTYRDMLPPITNPLFSNPFVMDPTDANHLMTGGPEIVETVVGPETPPEVPDAPENPVDPADWVEVFNLDEGNEGATRQMSMVELQGAAAYVGWCSTCDIVNKDPEEGQIFESGLATNMGGDKPAQKASPDGWHIAAANGLPERYISGIAADPKDPNTVYVVLANYANRQWWPVGSFNDANPAVGEGHVFKSTDAGENFTDITGDLVDVPARSIELHGDSILVGTDVGMFISKDSEGGQWAAPAGLPNVPVVSIRNHPGIENQVVLATFGRGFYSYDFPLEQAPVATAREIFDACPEDRVPRNSRGDDNGNVHEFAIDCMVWWEIAKGTSSTMYEPAKPVSRAQMASFIARLIEESGGELPADAADAFSDDNGQAPHEANINKLAAAKIIAGKGDGTYDPQGAVTRDQMAKFIVEAYEFRSDKSIVVPGDYFGDDNGNTHEDNINKSAAAGFTNGRNGGYDPAGVVRRDQMASFLARTLDLLVEEGTSEPHA